MSDGEKPIGLMVRLPPDLHEAVKHFSEGNQRRPATSLNSAIVFLLRAGLATVEKAEQGDKESGQLLPALMTA